MSESAGRACAWQFRFADRWADCTLQEFNRFQQNSPMTAATETRALVPEQLLVEAEKLAIARKEMIQVARDEASAANKKLAAVRALADELEADNYGTLRNLDAYAQKIRALTEKSEETR